MSAKHTPGPWVRVELDAAPGVYRLRVVSESLDIDVCDLNCDRNDVEAVDATDSDADLIAAAPELLAALKALADQFDRPGLTQHFYQSQVDAIRAAIAKAEGRS